MFEKIREVLTAMLPSNLAQYNIDALEEKVKDGTITNAQSTYLADMKAGGAGSAGQAVDYAKAWKDNNY